MHEIYPLYLHTTSVHLKMSLINVDFVLLDEDEKLELCFREGTFATADFICNV